MKNALLVFAKNLIHGEVKTRLAATEGHDVAFQVYRELISHTESVINYLPLHKFVFYSKFIENQDVWKNEIFEKQVQIGKDLGERMENAFSITFNKGYKKAVLIGTDCFEISAAIIMNAYDYLNNHDVIIGPAIDGGYYLLAMKELHSEIFKAINWSTDKVLDQTLEACRSKSLSVHLLAQLSDIDDATDFGKIKGELLLKLL